MNRNPRAFELVTTTQSEPQRVYECLEDDCGQALQDSLESGRSCITVTLDPRGGYPCFTASVEQLRELEPA